MWTGASISNRSSSLSPSNLISPGNTSYQPPLRSVRRNAVMSFLFTDCVAARSTESTDLDSLPGSQLACVALCIPPHPPSLPSSPPLSRSAVTSSCLTLAYIRTILYKLFTWKHCARIGKQWPGNSFPSAELGRKWDQNLACTLGSFIITLESKSNTLKWITLI